MFVTRSHLKRLEDAITKELGDDHVTPRRDRRAGLLEPHEHRLLVRGEQTAPKEHGIPENKWVRRRWRWGLWGLWALAYLAIPVTWVQSGGGGPWVWALAYLRNGGARWRWR